MDSQVATSGRITSANDSIDFAKIVADGFAKAAENAVRLRDSKAVQAQLVKAAEMIVETYSQGGCLFACGNGGSAADAQHLVAEMVSKLQQDRTPIRAFAMTVDTSILTAIGNDYGYDLLFHRQVKGLMSKNDILLAITTSGKSPNVLKALQACKEVGCRSLLLTGKDGGPARELADHTILATGDFTAAIQESHLVIYHLLCYLVEKGLVSRGLCKYL